MSGHLSFRAKRRHFREILNHDSKESMSHCVRHDSVRVKMFRYVADDALRHDKVNDQSFELKKKYDLFN
jgi:hypothetical protein